MTRSQTVIEEWLRKDRNPAPAAKLMGFQLTDFEDGVARIEMDADVRHHNPMGIIHGGVLCDLADAAMGMAFAGGLDENESFVTLQLSATYLRTIRVTRLVATARVLQKGQGPGHAEAEVTDVEGRLIARFSCTCLVQREAWAF